MNRSNNPKRFLSGEEQHRIFAKIAAAEKLTSAEIKLVIIKRCRNDIRKKAYKVFKKYKLDQTDQRNCVLVLLVTADRQFLIYGDQGIHQKVGPQFWFDVESHIATKFKENKMGEGLCAGIHLIAKKLAYYFPYQRDDRNEISNDIVFQDI
ncbi:MAG: TPM domain-containing protein [Desulfobacterales bacterium]